MKHLNAKASSQASVIKLKQVVFVPQGRKQAAFQAFVEHLHLKFCLNSKRGVNVSRFGVSARADSERNEGVRGGISRRPNCASLTAVGIGIKKGVWGSDKTKSAKFDHLDDLPFYRTEEEHKQNFNLAQDSAYTKSAKPLLSLGEGVECVRLWLWSGA